MLNQVLTMWIVDQQRLGNKAPRPNGARVTDCPACKHLVGRCRLSARHVLEDCVAVRAARERLGINAFFSDCEEIGVDAADAFYYYLNGMDIRGGEIPVSFHLLRGDAILELQEEWLAQWDS